MKELLNTKKKKVIASIAALVIVIGCIYIATSVAGAANDQNTGIGLEKSVSVALADAGLTRDQVQNLKGKFEKDDGLSVYDVYFEANGYEYEYTIKAADGTILESDIETPDGKSVTALEAKDIGLEKAKAAVLQHAGLKESAVEFTKSKKDIDDGRIVYEFEFSKDLTEYEYDIDGTTGEILSFSKEKIRNSADNEAASSPDNNSGSGSAAGSGSGSNSGSASSGSSSGSSQPSSDYIGVDKAKSIALNHAGLKAASVTFTKAKLDRDDGRMIYEIEFFNGYTEYEYEIDAISGKILDYDIERDDDYYDHHDDHDDHDDHDFDDDWDD